MNGDNEKEEASNSEEESEQDKSSVENDSN